MAIIKGTGKDPDKVYFTDRNGIQHDLSHVYWRRSVSDEYIHVWPDPKPGYLKVWAGRSDNGVTVPTYKTPTEVEPGNYELVAMPKSGYMFSRWNTTTDDWATSNTFTDNPITVKVDSKMTYQAVAWFIATQCYVTVKSDDPTMGTTTPEYIGRLMHCPNTITITATPLEGYAFVRWSDGDTNATRRVTYSEHAASYEWIAYFVKRKKATVHLKSNGDGFVRFVGDSEWQTDITREFYLGDRVGIECKSIGDYSDETYTGPYSIFDGWNDGSKSTSRILILDTEGDLEYTANFTTAAKFTATNNFGNLIVYITEGGSTYRLFYTTGLIPVGSVLRITPTFNTGYKYSRWYPISESEVLEATLSESTSYVFECIGERSKAFIQTAVDPLGCGIVTPNYSEPTELYTYTNVILTAQPSENYKFVGWSDGVTSATRTVQLKTEGELYKYTATFVKSVAYLQTLVSPEGGGTVDPYYPEPTELNLGTTVTLTATPNEDYIFTGWSDGVKDNPRSITLSEVMHLYQYTANFELQHFYIDVITTPAKAYVENYNYKITPDLDTIPDPIVVGDVTELYKSRWSDCKAIRYEAIGSGLYTFVGLYSSGVLNTPVLTAWNTWSKGMYRYNDANISIIFPPRLGLPVNENPEIQGILCEYRQ